MENSGYDGCKHENDGPVTVSIARIKEVDAGIYSSSGVYFSRIFLLLCLFRHYLCHASVLFSRFRLCAFVVTVVVLAASAVILAGNYFFERPRFQWSLRAARCAGSLYVSCSIRDNTRFFSSVRRSSESESSELLSSLRGTTISAAFTFDCRRIFWFVQYFGPSGFCSSA